MWPFGSKKDPHVQESPVLVATVRDEVCRIYPEKVPTEELRVIGLKGPKETLILTDSLGATHSYDLSSLFEEGVRHLHLSVRVGPTFAVQADALLTADLNESDPSKAFLQGKINGVRFQPFFLPECQADPASLVGRGLFYRGIHFAGTITQGNVSLLCICDACRGSFRLQSFHAGFGNEVYFYCSGGSHTLVASGHLEDAPPLLAEPDPEALRRFEHRLPPCEECGGQFRYLNPLRCPSCAAPYIDFARHPGDRQREYYGNHLYGHRVQKWAP